MSKPEPEFDPGEQTFPLRSAARLTGISPGLLRAWERRHAVVQPMRTAGGTRRYRAQDIERLRLVKAAVDAGHRISEVAQLEPTELERRCAGVSTSPTARIDDILAAIGRLDGAESGRLLSLQFCAAGPARFVRKVALPLVIAIGERWTEGRMGIAHEHLATGLLRSLLGSALQPTVASLLGPRIIFATPSGEPHELGLLMAALTAEGAGANPLYLGADLPVADLLQSAETIDAAALALSIVTLPAATATQFVGALREQLASRVRFWVGGAGARAATLPRGVEHIDDLEALEHRVALLAAERRP